MWNTEHKREAGGELALRSTVERGNISHFTCQCAETSCNMHAKMPKNYAIYVPKCRNVLHSTWQNAEKLRHARAKMPKRPALHMAKCRKITQFTCQNAETSCTPHAKMPKNYAIYVPKCRNALHSCQNAETSHTLHATTSKRTHLLITNFIYHTPRTRIPRERNTVPSHYKDHSTNFAWSNSLCLP